MNRQTAFFLPRSADAPREDWLRAGVLAGFLATFAMTVVLVAAYSIASIAGNANGNTIERWLWALANNRVAERTSDQVVLAIGANLVVGLLFALVYARVVDPAWSGPAWWKGMRFSLIPWLLSLIIFLPVAGGGLLGFGIGAGPLPILGNLILHLVYGAVLGVTYAEAAEDWLDDTEVDHANAAAGERGAAVGVAVGLPLGFLVGWAIAPTLDGLASQSESAIGMAFIFAALGLAIGSFAAMGRGSPARAPLPRR